MSPQQSGKWVKDKELLFPPDESCYLYKRPRSNVWQYFLSISPEEGSERKSTKESDLEKAMLVARERFYDVRARQQAGLKSKRSKTIFEFFDDFLENERGRIASYNRSGSITAETFRIKAHHLNLFKTFYESTIARNPAIEKLNYPKIKKYPTWRQTKSKSNPKPPKTQHTVACELTTIKGYFAFLRTEGWISVFPEFDVVKRENLREMRRDYLNIREYQQTLNTLRKWKNQTSLTKTQKHNRCLVYESLIIMANSCMRIGELKGLRWSDLEPNPNLAPEDQDIGHLIKVRKETSKVGMARTVQSPCKKRFDEIRSIHGLLKKQNTLWPHVDQEFKHHYILHKYGHPDEPLGRGTWQRLWDEIKDLCQDRYWGNKNITFYSFRHTGISFAVQRGVEMLQLSRNAGTGFKYISDVYFHHEAESKRTWDMLNRNRKFYDRDPSEKSKLLVEIEDLADIH
mgnify:CR=1 FL=1